MKSALFILAAIGAVSAQNRSDFLPECSLKCLDDATKQATDCALDDAVCWCVQSNYEAIYNAGVACVLQECGADVSVDQVLPAAAEFCAAATASAAAGATKTTAVTGDNEPPKTTTGPTATGKDGAAVTSSEAVATTTASGAAGVVGVPMLLVGALAML